MSLPWPVAAATGVPVTPDRDTARRLLVEELSDPGYRRSSLAEAQRALEWLLERLESLLNGVPANGSVPVALLVGLVAVAAAVVAARLVTGPARLRQSARPAARGGVFGAAVRSAAEHAAAAQAAAAEGRWAEAVQESFRCLARDLEERTLLDPSPGLTAREIAGAAATPFPSLVDDLRIAAGVFDDVTFGGRPGTREQWQAVDGTARAVAGARPVIPSSHVMVPAP